MIDKRISYRFGGHPGASHEGAGSGQTSGNGNQGSDRGHSRFDAGYYGGDTTPQGPAPQEERVSPIESLARVGDISLAGKTKTEADNEIAARNREEAARRAVTTPPVITDKREDYISKMYTPPPVTTIDERVPDRIKNIITPPVTKRDDSDYKTSLTDTTNYKDKVLGGLFNWGLTKNFPQVAIAKGIYNLFSPIHGGPKVDPYSTVKSAFSNINTTPKKGTGTIDTKERGEGGQFDKIPVQQAISKDKGLESGRKLLGLSDEETNYFKKLFASSDRKF